MTRLNAGFDLSNQTASASFRVPGTSMRLSYNGHRVPGYQATQIVDIPLTGPEVPDSAKRIEFELEVAGQRHTETFDPQPNLTHTFHWDGEDAYGRPVSASQWVDYRVGYVFDAVYREPAGTGRSFGGQDNGGSGESDGSSGGGSDDRRTVRREVTQWAEISGKDHRLSVEALDNRTRSLGGWALDVHHEFDPITNTVHLGDGGERRVSAASDRGGESEGPTVVAGIDPDRRVRRGLNVGVAADGAALVPDSLRALVKKIPRDEKASIFAGALDFESAQAALGDEEFDTGPPLGTALPDAQDITRDGDGRYYAVVNLNQIVSWEPGGTVEVFAGQSSPGYSGDGGPATEAQLFTVTAIEATDDGTVFIVDTGNRVVRRVTPDGTIDTVAGGGDGVGDGGGPATGAQLLNPYDVAVADDGTVYVSEIDANRVRQFTPGGDIEPAAGRGQYGYDGDGAPATDAALADPHGIAVGDDGTLYVADQGNGVVRAVSDGTITTAAGTQSRGYSGDGGPATEARLVQPRSVATTDEGGVYVLDTGARALRYVDGSGTISYVGGVTEAAYEGQRSDGESPRSVEPSTNRPGASGVAATTTSLGRPGGLAIGSDGSTYIAEGGSLLRRVGPDGTIERVAGVADASESTGDGGPASEARFEGLADVAVGPDGSVYLVDQLAFVVRRIRPDGVIERFAGDGDRPELGDQADEDGGPATDASLNNPSSVAVDGDGNVYIGTTRLVRRVGTDGTISTVAGGGNQEPTDGMAARDAQLDIWDVAVGPNDNLFVCTQTQAFRLTPEGELVLVAGNGEFPDDFREFSGEVATEVPLEITNLAVDGSGRIVVGINRHRAVHVVSTGGNITTAVGPGLRPAQTQLQRLTDVAAAGDGEVYYGDGRGAVYRLGEERSTGRQIPSSDGSEVYEFTLGGRHRRTYDGLSGEVRREFEYDDEGRLATVVDSNGGTTTVERDDSGAPTALVAPDGRRTALSTTGDGYVERIEPPAGGAVACSYADGGRLVSIEDRAGDARTYSYTPVGRVSQMTDQRGGTHSLTREDASDGKRLVHTFPSGRERTYTVRRDGVDAVVELSPDDETTRLNTRRVRQTTSAMEVETVPRQDDRFDLQTLYAGEVTRSWDSRSTTTTVEQTAEAWSESGVGSMTRRTVVDGTVRRTVTYDPDSGLTIEDGNRTMTARRTASEDGGATVTATIPGLSRVESITDGDGRVTAIRESADGTTREVTIARDGPTAEPSSFTLPAGERFGIDRDANGDPTAITLPGERTVAYDRTPRGYVQSVTLPGGPTHEFEWESGGLLSSYTPPVGGTVSYSYDADGRVSEVSLPTGETLGHEYDEQGRLQTLSTPAGETSHEYADSGALSSVSGPGGQSLSFEHAGPLPGRQQFAGPVSGAVAYDYTDDGRIAGVTVDGGTTVDRSFGSGGRPIVVGEMELTRDADHGLLTGTSVEGVTDSWSYDSFGNVTRRTTEVDGATVFEASYETDDAGRITSLTETIGGTTATRTYEYDEGGRLAAVREDGSTAESFDYDDRDNVVEMTDGSGSTTLEYDDADRITAAGERSYSHDEAGRLTSIDGPDGTTELSYDARDTLTGVTLPDGTEIEYVVDPMGRRVGKRVDGSLDVGWLYVDDLRPVAELGADGSVVSQFVYGREATVPDYVIRDGTRYRLVTDHRESVRLVVNAETGEIAQRLDYDAFGRVTRDTNPGFQPFGFAGGLYDPDTGLVRFGQREYDPRIGRWTSRDPIGFQGSTLNLYSYARNDPINVRDPRGLAAPAAVALVLVAAAISGVADYAIQANTGDGSVNWAQTAISTVLGGLTVGAEGLLGSLLMNAGKGALARIAASLGLNTLLSGAGQVAKNCVSQTKEWSDGVFESMGLEALLNAIGPGQAGLLSEALPSSAKGVSDFLGDQAGDALEVAGAAGESILSNSLKGIYQSGSSSSGSGQGSGSVRDAGSAFGKVDLGGQANTGGGMSQSQACYPPGG